MTNNREDYLKTIFKLYEREGKVTNKMIAERMGIAPASVSEMLKKLQKEGMIIIGKNMVMLTDEGIERTKRVLSCHRLWEKFLLEYLDYNWQDVHGQADLLEHVTSDMLKDKLNAFLAHPKCCPHGSIIYENWEEPIEKGLYMGDLIKGQKAVIIRVEDNRELLGYIDRLKLMLNDEIEVVERDSFDGSLVILHNDEKINISAKALQHIYVRVIKDEK